MWRCALSNGDDVARAALGRAFHETHSRLVAALVRRFGAAQLDLALNAVQEAMVRALERWPREGVPEQIEGWLLRVAHNQAIDTLRSQARRAARDAAYEPGQDANDLENAPSRVDDELALMFLCCHPALPAAAQVTLTLKVASGFTVAQIASAFLTDARTVAQRIVRAKQRLRDEKAVFVVPDEGAIAARVGPILDALYLVFNEGHSPSDGEAAVSDAFCNEALRITRLLTASARSATPSAEALHALLCFQASRTSARQADDGGLLLLPEQDRARWDSALVYEAFTHLGRAARGDTLSRFHLEAGIAACHAMATTYASTDWPRIVSLYDALRGCAPSPIVEVNRAVAIAMTDGPLAGIDALDAIPERDLVARYPFALAAYAELHASLGHIEEARAYLVRALAHQPAKAQQMLLTRKLNVCRELERGK